MSLKNFLKINKKIITKKNSDKFVLVLDRGRVPNALLLSIYAAILNKKYNFNVKTILTKKEKMKSIFESFGEMKFIKSSSLGNIKNIFYCLKACFFILENFFFIKKKKFEWFINNFQINNIKVGDLIYDSYIRYNHRYIKPKIDITFLSIILTTYVKVQILSNIIKNKNLKYILIGQQMYSSLGSIALRLGIKYRIKTIEPIHYNFKDQSFIIYDKNLIYYGYNNFYYSYLKNNKKFFNKYKISEKKYNKFFFRRAKGDKNLRYTGIKDLQQANKVKNKLYLSRQKFLGQFGFKNNEKNKIILIAFHAFSDAPHGAGIDLLFRDFYAHAKETLEFLNISGDKKTLYLLKPHPSRFLYNEHNLFEDLYEEIIGRKKKNIKICPDYLNLNELTHLCDSVATLKGTIALEFISKGKPALTCGVTPFSKLDIAQEAKNKKEYFNYLKKLSFSKKKLNKNKILKAQKVLYFLENFMSNPQNYLGTSEIIRFNENTIDYIRKQRKIDSYFTKEVLNKIITLGFLKDKPFVKLNKLI